MTEEEAKAKLNKDVGNLEAKAAAAEAKKKADKAEQKAEDAKASAEHEAAEEKKIAEAIAAKKAAAQG